MQPNAVIYARYSSSNQKEISIEGQLRECHAYAKRCGYNVVGEYIDRAKSGTKDNRPEFQKMISDSTKKQFEFIIVWKVDRFARNRYDSAIYKNNLKKSGVRVVSATEAIGEGSEAIIVEAILEAMAEVYSRQLGENTRRGMKDTALNGQCTGGNIPLGYRIENKFLVKDEETAFIVEYIFKQYAAGMTKTQIVKACTEKGYRTKYGKLFNVNSIGFILKNRMYIGDYNYKGEIERTCPALISEELFNDVQQRLEMCKRARGKPSSKAVYQLSGKLFCGHCGDAMTGESARGRNGEPHYYYTCHKRKKYKQCDKKREKKDFIEWYVVEQTLAYVLAPGRVDYIAERVVSAYNEGFSVAEIEKLEKRLSTIDIEISNCADALIHTRSQAVMDKINEKAELLETQKQETEIELAKLKIAAEVALTVTEVKAWLQSFCKGDLFDDDFRRRIIDTFINAVYLYDDKIVIYFNIKGGKQISYMEMKESIGNNSEMFRAVTDKGSQDKTKANHFLYFC